MKIPNRVGVGGVIFEGIEAVEVAGEDEIEIVVAVEVDEGCAVGAAGAFSGQAGALGNVGEVAGTVVGEKIAGIAIVGIEVGMGHLAAFEGDFVLGEEEVEVTIAIDIACGEGLGVAEARFGAPDQAGRIGKAAYGFGDARIFCAFEKMEAVLPRAKEIYGAIAGEVSEDCGEEQPQIVGEETLGSKAAVRGAADDNIRGGENDFELAVGIEVPENERVDEVGTGWRRNLSMEHLGEGGRAGAGTEFELGGIDALESVGG